MSSCNDLRKSIFLLGFVCLCGHVLSSHMQFGCHSSSAGWQQPLRTSHKFWMECLNSLHEMHLIMARYKTELDWLRATVKTCVILLVWVREWCFIPSVLFTCLDYFDSSDIKPPMVGRRVWNNASLNGFLMWAALPQDLFKHLPTSPPPAFNQIQMSFSPISFFTFLLHLHRSFPHLVSLNHFVSAPSSNKVH